MARKAWHVRLFQSYDLGFVFFNGFLDIYGIALTYIKAWNGLIGHLIYRSFYLPPQSYGFNPSSSIGCYSCCLVRIVWRIRMGLYWIMNLLYFMYVNDLPLPGLTSRLKAPYVFLIGVICKLEFLYYLWMWGCHMDTPKEQDSRHALCGLPPL